MSDEEVNILLKEIDISKLEDRDSQEVVGYFEAFDIISESFASIEITENSLKNLHNILMKYSKKDEWHKGNYKQHSNAVEAKYPDGGGRRASLSWGSAARPAASPSPRSGGHPR